MKRLSKYVSTSVFSSMTLVTLMLTGLQAFILMVNQLDDIGRGRYALTTALAYVSLSLPGDIYVFFPMVGLIGTLVGLGVLASHSELVIMRASGLSALQIMRMLVKPMCVIILAVSLMGEFLAPHLSYFANTLKFDAIFNGTGVRSSTGLWLRQGQDFIFIQSIDEDKSLSHVLQLHFSNENHPKLLFARNVDKIISTSQALMLRNVTQTEFTKETLRTTKFDNQLWELHLDESLFNVNLQKAEELPLWPLWVYVQAMKKNHQSVALMELNFWQRLFEPITTFIMILLAVPFIFGPLRQSSMGIKLVTGIGVGFGFHLLSRFMGPLTAVYQLSPFLVAFLPILVFTLMGLILIRRVR